MFGRLWGPEYEMRDAPATLSPLPHGRVRTPASKRGFKLRFLGYVFAFLCLTALVGFTVLQSVLQDGHVSAEALKPRFEAVLANALGGDGEVSIEGLSFDFGSNGSAQVVLSDVSLSDPRFELSAAVREARAEFALLPLLWGEVRLRAVRASDASLRLPEAQAPVDWPSILSSHDAGTLLRTANDLSDTVYGQLSRLELETVAIDRLVVRRGAAEALEFAGVRLDRDPRYERGLDLTVMREGAGQFGAQWRRTDGGTALAARLSGLDLGMIPAIRQETRAPFDASGAAVVMANMDFDADGAPGDVKATFAFGTGSLRLGHEEPVGLKGATLRVRFAPDRHSLRIEPSPFATDTVSGVLEGGVKRASNGRLEFEFVANRVVSRAGGVRQAQRATVGTSGHFDLASRDLAFERYAVRTPTGTAEGTASISFHQWPPALDATLRTDGFDAAAVRAFWPAPLAGPAWRWLSRGSVEGGRVVSADLSANIPAGVLGRLRHGARIAPDELFADVRFEGTTIRTVGDLPSVRSASGRLQLVGQTVTANLTSGEAEGGRGLVAMAGTTFTVPDFGVWPPRAVIEARAQGRADAVMAVAAQRPISLAQRIDLDADRLSGEAIVDARVEVPLVAPKPKDVLWSAGVTLQKASVKGRWQGREVVDADVRIMARDGEARIEGDATVDGVRARLAIVEPFGVDRRTMAREASLVLRDADRKRLGLTLGGLLKGPVSVALTDGGGATQRVRANLKDASIEIAALNWSKGRGIPATATFAFRTEGGKTFVDDLVISGEGFRVEGDVVVANGGITGSFPRVTLNRTDRSSVRIRRAKRGYSVTFAAQNFDARAFLEAFQGSGGGSSGSGVDLEVAGTIGRLGGFKREAMRDAELTFTIRKGSIRRLELAGRLGAGSSSLAIAPREGGGQSVTLRSSDPGSLLRFANLYGQVSGGTLRADLVRAADGSLAGRVSGTDFTVQNEPRLARFAERPQQVEDDGEVAAIYRKVKKQIEDRVVIRDLRADISKVGNTLRLRKGRLLAGDSAVAFKGLVYDANGRMDVSGTFLPAYGLNRIASKIPIVGLAFGEGRKRGLLGITFALRGRYDGPRMLVNPISILAPGVFRKIFEFR